MSATSHPLNAPADRFTICVARLLRTEGGKVNHAADRGGATNWGISRRFLREKQGHPLITAVLDHSRPASDDDVMKLTKLDAIRLYRGFFWDANSCGSMPLPIDGAVFDQCVNGGGAETLQNTLNLFYHSALTVDGAIGPKTLARLCLAVADVKVGTTRFLTSFRSVAENRYRDIVRADPSQKVFLAGWVARARVLGNV